MATVPYHLSTASYAIAPPTIRLSEPRRLNRIQEVRKQQGVSLRTASRRTGIPAAELRQQEQEDSDLLLSQLQVWCEILDVPAADLLEEPKNDLSAPIRERAKLVRIMKTTKAILERTKESNVKILAETLINQLTDLMPELEEVNSWNNVGQRRSLDELGRIVDRRVSEDMILRAMRDD
jgi:transcriptional regulator with XRE-family HTH domain